MQLFYAPDIVPPEYTLSEEESKHCIRVLRMTCGEELHITDGRGNLYRCEIVDDNPKRCRVRVHDTNSEFGKLPYRLTMAVAPTKNNDRFEWFLEKATEIGVAEIIPLATEHSERRTLKPERENKVITAAVKQSLKAYHPRLHEMTPLRQVIKQPFDGQKFIAHCDAPRSALGKAFLPRILHKGGDVLVLDRAGRGLLARGDRPGRPGRFPRNHARLAAPAHGNGRRHGDRIGGCRQRTRNRNGRQTTVFKTGTMKQLWEIFWSFFKIGLFTFGGGYAMIPLIQREVIDHRKWIPASEFLDLLTLAQSVPGPIAINTAVFVGYKRSGLRGACASLLGAVLPSFLIILAIALFFAGIRQNPVVDAAFKGMRPAVVALIIAPLVTLTRGMHWSMIVLAAALAGLIWWLGLSPVLILAAGAGAGIVWELSIAKKSKQ